MKRMSRISCTLAMLLMSLGAVTSANALALKAFSTTLTYDGTPATTTPNPGGTGGMPIWFQGADGTSVQPCIVTGCGVLAGGTFTAFPVAFPLNYPVEAFYFAAQTPVAGANPATQIGATGIFTDVFAGLEFTTIGVSGLPGVSPTAAGGVVLGTFQRLRVTVDPLATPAVGIWTVDHPWGTTTFDAATAKKHGTGVQITIDVPAAAPNDFGATLGFPVTIPQQFSMSTFLKSTAATAPFLGDALTPVTYTGGPVRNFFQVTGPPGTTGPINLAIITGKTIGMDVQPSGNINCGQVNVSTPKVLPAAKTIKIINTTANDLTFPAITAPPVTAGDPATDFAIVNPSATAGALPCTTVLAGAACSFDINFNPSAASPKGLRAATITLAPTAALLGVVQAPPPPVTLNLNGALVVNVTTTTDPATPHGTLTIDPIGGVTFAGTAPIGTPITFTAKADPKFKVKSVSDGIVLLGSPPGTPPFTLNTAAVSHAVTATFMPSGDLNGDGVFDAADALKALKILAGVQAPVADDKAAMILAPLDASGKPNPAAGRVEPGIGDVLVILKRALGLVTF